MEHLMKVLTIILLLMIEKELCGADGETYVKILKIYETSYGIA